MSFLICLSTWFLSQGMTQPFISLFSFLNIADFSTGYVKYDFLFKLLSIIPFFIFLIQLTTFYKYIFLSLSWFCFIDFRPSQNLFSDCPSSKIALIPGFEWKMCNLRTPRKTRNQTKHWRTNFWYGIVTERNYKWSEIKSIWLIWSDVWVAERARLLIECTFPCTEGSNPSHSV